MKKITSIIVAMIGLSSMAYANYQRNVTIINRSQNIVLTQCKQLITTHGKWETEQIDNNHPYIYGEEVHSKVVGIGLGIQAWLTCEWTAAEGAQNSTGLIQIDIDNYGTQLNFHPTEGYLRTHMELTTQTADSTVYTITE